MLLLLFLLLLLLVFFLAVLQDPPVPLRSPPVTGFWLVLLLGLALALAFPHCQLATRNSTGFDVPRLGNFFLVLGARTSRTSGMSGKLTHPDTSQEIYEL